MLIFFAASDSRVVHAHSLLPKRTPNSAARAESQSPSQAELTTLKAKELRLLSILESAAIAESQIVGQAGIALPVADWSVVFKGTNDSQTVHKIADRMRKLLLLYGIESRTR